MEFEVDIIFLRNTHTKKCIIIHIYYLRIYVNMFNLRISK